MNESRSITPLDARLYAWLTEGDAQRFERAFAAYYAVAFPAVCRHLARLSRWDLAELEELAQDALLRFFEKAGRGRRASSEAIEASLRHVNPLRFNPFHDRQVSGWTHDCESFRVSVMSFMPASGEFKDAIRSFTDRIPPLQSRGDQVLKGVAMVDDPQSVGAGDPFDGVAYAARFSVTSPTPTMLAASGPTELQGFVTHAAVVIESLPGVRVPTNSYLFDMALTIYFDQCRKRKRIKRGGEPSASSGQAHPLERLGGELEVPLSPDEPCEPAEGRAVAVNADFHEPSVEPMRQFEDQDFLEKFYGYLREPVDNAQVAYEKARQRGRATEQLKRFESLSNKFARTIAVLGLLGEGYTQEQAAERLELSRNQVKYILEIVQEAFQRFEGAHRSDIQGVSHG